MTSTPAHRTVAVILAGGTGSRVGLQVPKQLLKVAGKPIIEYSIAAFDAHPGVEEILVVMTPGFVPDAEQIVAAGRYGKVSQVLEGGTSRNESTLRALDALGDVEANVLFHDAVRPLIDARIISDSIQGLARYEAVDVAIASSDTVIEVQDDCITSIPDRSRLRRGQTPQGFRLSTIRRAYHLAAADPHFQATDDCGVLLRYLPEVPILVVEGSEQNMKVTHPIDVYLADKLFQLSSGVVPGHSSEEHRELLHDKVIVVFGGSYGIGGDVVALARGYGATVHPFSRTATGTHVEKPDDVRAALREAHAVSGRIDYVVNTAGVLRRGDLEQMDDAAIEETLRVNLLAPATIARASLGYLAETKGHLLLYTSSSYTRGRAGYSLYSSTKAAVVNLTQALAEEWAPVGVRVNCINPERTSTPMRRQAFGAEPPGSLLSSRAVALTSLDVLLSDLTGQVVDVRQARKPAAAASGPATTADMVAEVLKASAD